MTAKQIPMIRKRNLRLVVAQINDQPLVAIEKKYLGDLPHVNRVMRRNFLSPLRSSHCYILKFARRANFRMTHRGGEIPFSSLVAALPLRPLRFESPALKPVPSRQRTSAASRGNRK